MTSLEVGARFAGYRIVRRLGAGGMGTMYLAHDDDLDRPVALKLLTVEVSEENEGRARFLREAKTIAGLDHPNIVSVYARGEFDGQLWIAMQFIDGTDASTPVRTGTPMDASRVVHIIADTAAALDYAHDRGILHRDVKPANILLARGTNRVLLADFGIAKALEATTALRTNTGLVVASLQYAAPEQLDPSIELDRRVDVYALGATLYHLITGMPPYTGTLAQVVNSHLNAPIPVPSEYGAPLAFDEVVARAMAKDRAQRYATCGELAAAARAALESGAATTAPTPPPVLDAPTLLRPAEPEPTRVSAPNPPVNTLIAPSTPEQTLIGGPPPASPQKRKRRMAPILGAVLAVLVLAVVGVVLLTRGGDTADDEASTDSAGGSLATTLAGHEDAVTGIVATERNGDTVIATGSFDTTVRLWDPHTGRQIGAPLEGFTDIVTDVVAYDDGDRHLIVAASRDGTIRVWDAATSNEVGGPIEAHSGGVYGLEAAELAGQAVVVSGGADGTIRVWNPVTGEQIGDPGVPAQGEIRSLAIGAGDGGPVAVVATDSGDVVAWDLVDSRPIGAAEPVGASSVSTAEIDGRTTVVSGGWDGLHSWKIGEQPGAAFAADEPAFVVAAGEDGGVPIAVAGNEDGSVRVWDLRSNTRLTTDVPSHTDGTYAVALVEIDGRQRLISSGMDTVVTISDLPAP